MNSPPAGTIAAGAPAAVRQPRPLGVAIAGLGAIGRELAAKLAAGIPGITLAAVATGNRDKGAAFLATVGAAPPLVDAAALAAHAELIIECAPPAVFEAIARPALSAGRKLMVLSVGRLLDVPDLVDLARARGGQIIVPSGALLGLDAVTAAAEGEIRSVRMVTRKPVRGLVGAPYLVEHGIRIEGITAPLRVFSGTAREAARGFPANLNVAVALSLAGIGPDRTTIEIWADPALTRNTHRIEVDADSASFSMTIENVPSDNPKTGRITALSAIAALRKIASPLRVGT